MFLILYTIVLYTSEGLNNLLDRFSFYTSYYEHLRRGWRAAKESSEDSIINRN